MPIFNLFGKPDHRRAKKKRDYLSLIKALSHEDAAVRNDAVIALSESDGVKYLINILRNWVLAQHGQQLRALGGRTVLQGTDLVDAMNSTDPELESRIKHSIDALVMMGKKSVRHLINRLDDEVLVPYAVRILVAIGEPSVGLLIKAREEGKSIRSRQNAAEALRQIGESGAEKAPGSHETPDA